MAVFLNPQGSKEQWLMQHGIPTAKPSWVDKPEGTFPVCLVINGIFVNANIAHNVQEFKYLHRADSKPRHWFYVKIKDLLENSDLEQHLPKDSPILEEGDQETGS